MDFEALQAARESCRVYSDRPVPRETLAHLVDVARLAPSGCNAQPWRFIIIDEPEARAKLIEALDDDGLTGCPWGDRVPNFILICEDEAHVKPGVAEHYGAQHFAQMDIGMAAMALCYEATSMGLGTCLIGTMNQAKLHQSFGIPEERPVRLIVTVGYPAKETARSWTTSSATTTGEPGGPAPPAHSHCPRRAEPGGGYLKSGGPSGSAGAAGRPWDQPGAGLGSGAPGSASALPLSALHPMRRTGPLPLAQPLQP